MKKRLFFVMTLCMVAFISLLCVSAAEKYYPLLVDEAELLYTGEEKILNEKIEEFRNTYNADIVIAFLDDTDGMDPDYYVDYYYDNGGYGIGNSRDGVILLVAMAERDYRILSNGFCASAIDYSEIDYIGEDIAPCLSEGEYLTAAEIFIDKCAHYMDIEINGVPFKAGKSLIISVVIGFICAFVVTGIMKGRLKSVRSKNEADQYTKQGSMNITNSKELYLYRTVNRVKIDNGSSSRGRSSGSGSRRVGGGKF